MKKLFTINGKFSLVYIKRKTVFEVCDWNTHKTSFVDRQGRAVEVDMSGDESDDKKYSSGNCDDPTAMGEPDKNGSYIFTTHPYEWDPDGYVGQFGVKDKDGNMIIPEEYYCIEEANFGMYTACTKDWKWGLFGPDGKEILPCIYGDQLYFNKYGVGYGNDSLIDITGALIPETDNNYYTRINEKQRYIAFSYSTPEEMEEICKCGIQSNPRQSIFDSKERKVIITDDSEDVDCEFASCEPEVIIAAFRLKKEYDSIWVWDDGIIEAKRLDIIDVYDFYEYE